MLRRLQSRQEPASLQENCEPMLHHYRSPSQIFAVQSVTVPRFGESKRCAAHWRPMFYSM